MKSYIVEFESDYNRGTKQYIKFRTDNPAKDYYRAQIMKGDHSYITIYELKEI